MRTRTFATLALVAATALTGLPQFGYRAQASTPTALPSPASTALSTTPGGYLGVYERGVPQTYSPVETFARTVKRQPRLVLYFSGWGAQFQAAFAQRAHSHGSIPLIQMNPTNISLAAITAGQYDAYLTSYADQVRAYGYPVVIGFAHEMNGWWYSWGYGHTSPQVWKEAWRHIVTVFRSQGATNVTWLWTIDRNPRALSVVPRYWPGASYVDWVGVDGYYFRSTDYFRTIFGPVIRTIRKFTHKPILLSETAIGQVAGQATKIPDLFSSAIRNRLLGVVWYDVAQHGGLYHQDWRLEGHPLALRRFRSWASKMIAGG